MTLSEYVKKFPKYQRTIVRRRIAKFLQVSEVYVRSMCNGNRAIPGLHAIAIEYATKGVVPRHISCPQLYPKEE